MNSTVVKVKTVSHQAKSLRDRELRRRGRPSEKLKATHRTECNNIQEASDPQNILKSPTLRKGRGKLTICK